MRSFYLVSLIPNEGVSVKQVQEELNKAHDWYRFADNSWIIVTSKSVAIWHRRLSPYAGGDGQVFVCELDIKNRQGWMSNRFWKWLRKAEEISDSKIAEQ